MLKDSNEPSNYLERLYQSKTTTFGLRMVWRWK